MTNKPNTDTPKQTTTTTTQTSSNTTSNYIYKKRSELTIDEIKHLPTVKFKFVDTSNAKSNYKSYAFSFFLPVNGVHKDGTKKDDIVINVLDKSIVNYLNFEKVNEYFNDGIPTKQLVYKCNLRLLKGKRTDGSTYYLYEVFIGKILIFGCFFADGEIELLKMRKGSPIKFNEVPGVLSDEDDLATNTFEDDGFEL